MNNIGVLREKECRGCGVCTSICPVSAISMELDERGFYIANVSEDKCIGCGKCVGVCSVLNTEQSDCSAVAVYLAHDKDDARRIQSSSGGIVGVLAEEALKDGYTVIGAAYDYDADRVKHIKVTSIDEYYEMVAGSKYIPSLTVDAFKEIADIDHVMVIGTPCQIKALRRAYPNKDMICVDFRCYGVCGYALWDKYLESLRRGKSLKIRHIHSHSKISSWLKWGVEIDFEDGSKYFRPKTKDNFGKVFSGLEYAGEHCLKCNMSAEASFADIRVEDGWQLSEYLKSDDYKKGASQVTVMSDTGKKLWDLASGRIYCIDVGLKHALHGCQKHPTKKYLNELILDPALTIEEVISKYNKTIPITTRVFNYLCNLLFEVPSVYFAVKRMYRKIKRVDG